MIPMKPKTKLTLFILIGMAAGFGLRGCLTAPRDSGAPPADATVADFWTCSMHPQIKADKFGLCPLCAMDLIPVYSGDDVQLGPRELKLSETALALADIETAPVERRTLVQEIRMPGKIVYDESRLQEITSLAAGRIERLLVNYTGAPVRAGETLAEIYSPDALAASVEFLAAARAGGDSRDASRRRLELLGVADDQIDAALATGQPLQTFRLVSPADGVLARLDVRAGAWIERGQPLALIASVDPLWAELDAYESDIGWIETGQALHLTVEAFPGNDFMAEVTFVPAELNDRTRSVKVRANVPNPDGRLRPGMFLRAQLRREAPEKALAIPDTAPLLTGTRAVVYVKSPDQPGVFEGRVVTLGNKAGSYYEVIEGLSEGEQVVVRGNIRLDSAMQILARPSMMSAPALTPQRFDDIPSAFLQSGETLFAAYLRMQTALADDDFDAAQAAIAPLVAALDAMDDGSMEGPARDAWNGLARRISSALEVLQAAADIDAFRIAFEPLSMRLIDLARQFGLPPGLALHRAHCPMAFDDRGADWIQIDAVIANPYFGAQMLRCGSLEENLGGTPVPEPNTPSDPHAHH